MSQPQRIAELKAARDRAEAQLQQEEARIQYALLMDKMYKPEACRFGAECKKRTTCPHAHPYVAATAVAPAPAPAPAHVQAKNDCKFGAGCNNSKCTRNHPCVAVAIPVKTQEVCHYGAGCNNSKCTRTHPVATAPAKAQAAPAKAQRVLSPQEAQARADLMKKQADLAMQLKKLNAQLN